MRKLCGHILGALMLWTAPAVADVVKAMDFRIVLAQLAQKVGANGQIAILQAQGPAPAPAVVIQGGAASLSDVARLSGALVQDGNRFVLKRPLLIWSDAALRIGRDEVLFLDAARGAFLASFGSLDVTGGAIESGAPPSHDGFHPFVLVAGQGRLSAQGARFDNLGFGTIPAFSGVAIINRGIFPPDEPSRIAHSRFTQLGTLSLLSAEDTVLANNTIRRARGAGLTVRDSHRIVVENTDITQAQGHGIRISEGATDITVTGSRILSPGGAGLAIDSRSAGVRIADNTVSAPALAGIRADSAFCLALSGNTVKDAGSAGITLSRSARVMIEANTLRHNRSAGIAISAQPADADTALRDNRLIGNRVGIKGQSAGTLHFAGNDFSDQFPRFLDGDLASATRYVAADLRGQAGFDIAGAYDAREVILPDCTLPDGDT